ncbi:hypothetical protein [Flavonifractor plautii]|uniref:hypothetical protein n=1 Tax=Flavonifractor plautii TaxID=292800 RepID=UPI0018AB418F|nr:hypothetical protein [Flavonifractor plautii]
MPDAPKRKRLEKVAQDAPIISNQKFYCSRCGTAFSRQKGYFPVSHSPMYRGMGYLPFCNECIDTMYDEYKQELGGDRAAMRRMCMKLDLYWNDSIFDMVERTAGVNSKVRNYIGKTNMIRFIDKCFDDTIMDEGNIEAQQVDQEENIKAGYLQEDEADEDINIPEDVILFWGPGYTPKMYLELEERRKFWISRFPDGYNFDIGEEALIRQICNLEIDINHDRAAGKSIDKNVNTLNTLLGSANLKPAQKKNEEADAELDNMPFGVGIRKWENTRPIPEPDPELQDVDNIVRYITVWFLGHLCHMVGIKNTYCKLYEEEMERLRVTAPEFEDEDDETLFDHVFSESAEV